MPNDSIRRNTPLKNEKSDKGKVDFGLIATITSDIITAEKRTYHKSNDNSNLAPFSLKYGRRRTQNLRAAHPDWERRTNASLYKDVEVRSHHADFTALQAPTCIRLASTLEMNRKVRRKT